MPGYAIALIVVGALVLLVLAAWVILAELVFQAIFVKNGKQKIAYHAKWLDLDLTPGDEWLKTKSPEEVYILSKDGLKLHGRLVKDPNVHLYVIAVHGYRGSWHSHVLFASQLDKQLKSNYLFIDLRACGASEGKYITMGCREAEDLALWVDFIVKSDPEAKVVLYGVSLGGSTILRSLKDLPSQVKACICDSSFHDPYVESEFIAAKTLKKLAKPEMVGVNLLAKARIKVNLRDGGLADSLESNQIPILLIHSEEDTFVPFPNLELNYRLLPEKCQKEEVPFEHAPHALVFYFNREEYLKDVCSFLTPLL